MASLVAERRKDPDRAPDLLSVLLQAEREQGWTESEIVGEIFSVYFGAAVVATTLAWSLYMLGSHPDAQQQVIDEVRDVLNGRPPTTADLQNLVYTRAAILETVRLFPPSWGYPRYCKEGMEIDGYEIPPESMVIPMVYFTHRHPDYWESPEEFRPERFVGESAKQIHQFAHLPFGAGARICLGAQLAPMMITMVVAGVFQQLRLEYRPRFDGDPIADFGFEIHPQDQILVNARRNT
jgi:cytochrome P450